MYHFDMYKEIKKKMWRFGDERQNWACDGLMRLMLFNSICYIACFQSSFSRTQHAIISAKRDKIQIIFFLLRVIDKSFLNLLIHDTLKVFITHKKASITWDSWNIFCVNSFTPYKYFFFPLIPSLCKYLAIFISHIKNCFITSLDFFSYSFHFEEVKLLVSIYSLNEFNFRLNVVFFSAYLLPLVT